MLLDGLLQRGGVARPGSGVVGSVGATVGVRREHGVDALGWRQRAQRVVDGARRDLVGRRRPAVVAVADAEHVAAAGRRARQAQGEVVCLGPGRDEKDPLERIGQQRGQALGEERHALVEEPRVGVEQTQLAGRGCRHARMAVTDHRDVVDAVEVGAGLRVVEMLTPAAHDLGGRRVVDRLGLRNHGAAAREQVVRRPIVRREAEQHAGMRAEREPRFRASRRHQPGERQSGRPDLDVQVRRQLGPCSDAPDDGSGRDAAAHHHGGHETRQTHRCAAGREHELTSVARVPRDLRAARAPRCPRARTRRGRGGSSPARRSRARASRASAPRHGLRWLRAA